MRSFSVTFANIALSYGAKHVSMSSIVSAWLTTVTDGRTDRTAVSYIARPDMSTGHPE